jgi:hypothetical protein
VYVCVCVCARARARVYLPGHRAQLSRGSLKKKLPAGAQSPAFSGIIKCTCWPGTSSRERTSCNPPCWPPTQYATNQLMDSPSRSRRIFAVFAGASGACSPCPRWEKPGRCRLRFAHKCQKRPSIKGKRPSIEANETYYIGIPEVLSGR